MKLWKLLKASYPVARCKATLKYGHVSDDYHWEVRDAPPKGEGLFTTIFRPKGSVVFVATGATRYASFSGDDCFLYPNWYAVDENVWVDMQMPYVKANHSCKPNMGIDGTRIFVALRDIEEGEELVFDYSITDDEDDWLMECHCGEVDCREIIGSIHKMRTEHYTRSHPHIPSHFKKKYAQRKETKLNI